MTTENRKMDLKLLRCTCENRHMDFCNKYLVFILTQRDLKIIQFKEDSLINIYEFQSFKLLSCLAEHLCTSKLYFGSLKMGKNIQALANLCIPLPTVVFGFFPSYSVSRLDLSPKTVVNVVYS